MLAGLRVYEYDARKPSTVGITMMEGGDPPDFSKCLGLIGFMG